MKRNASKNHRFATYLTRRWYDGEYNIISRAEAAELLAAHGLDITTVEQALV